MQAIGARETITAIMNHASAEMNLESKDLDKFRSGANLEHLVGEMIKVYDKHFNEAEIRALLKFYSSAPGQKVIVETPKIYAECLKIGAQWASEEVLRLGLQIKKEDKQPSDDITYGDPVECIDDTDQGGIDYLVSGQQYIVENLFERGNGYFVELKGIPDQDWSIDRFKKVKPAPVGLTEKEIKELKEIKSGALGKKIIVLMETLGLTDEELLFRLQRALDEDKHKEEVNKKLQTDKNLPGDFEYGQGDATAKACHKCLKEHWTNSTVDPYYCPECRKNMQNYVDKNSKRWKCDNCNLNRILKHPDDAIAEEIVGLIIGDHNKVNPHCFKHNLAILGSDSRGGIIHYPLAMCRKGGYVTVVVEDPCHVMKYYTVHIVTEVDLTHKLLKVEDDNAFWNMYRFRPAEPRFKCKFCGALYYLKDRTPTCCQKAIDAKGNSAMEEVPREPKPLNPPLYKKGYIKGGIDGHQLDADCAAHDKLVKDAKAEAAKQPTHIEQMEEKGYPMFDEKLEAAPEGTKCMNCGGDLGPASIPVAPGQFICFGCRTKRGNENKKCSRIDPRSDRIKADSTVRACYMCKTEYLTNRTEPQYLCIECRVKMRKMARKLFGKGSLFPRELCDGYPGDCEKCNDKKQCDEEDVRASVDLTEKPKSREFVCKIEDLRKAKKEDQHEKHRKETVKILDELAKDETGKKE